MIAPSRMLPWQRARSPASTSSLAVAWSSSVVVKSFTAFAGNGAPRGNKGQKTPSSVRKPTESGNSSHWAIGFSSAALSGGGNKANNSPSCLAEVP
eukprot:CAMPEP_0171128170 /NCGR_PEP_ID=MMETSP0766_2-20121228/116579_1 /TAXON_ID=439317 /ORGANISM="Gambierdiscus australes, Strain CAWD 149" /LENGTH=95 /DNA_ID=CAMNT_0011591317 /DNA_START=1 /DNA_END=285 /DNA_ORIENTATION=+